MRAVGFFRVIPQAGPADPGNPDPATEIRLYCERNHHQLVNSFAVGNGLSAEDAYASVVAMFRGGRPALVVLPDATHLAQDLETFVSRMVELVELGGEVRCADVERPDPLQSAEELLSLRGRSAVRQRRVREAILAKASRGQVLGRTPYGYTAGADGQLKELPEEAGIVRRIFEWYAGPAPSAGSAPVGGIGLRLIAQRLNDAGHRTRQGHPWTQVAVAGVLRNRVYLGTYSRYGVRIVGSHPPLVQRDLFNRAEAVTSKRRPVRRRRSAEPFLLSGLLRSAVSGRSLFGLTRRRAWKRLDGSPMEKTYRYYECPHREPSPDGNGELIKLAWPAEKLEAIVRAQVLQWPDGCLEGATLADDDGSPDPAGRVRLAEREFSRAVRAVASGYGNVRDLKEPLGELRAARSAAQEPAGSVLDAARIRAMVADGDMAVARRAILAVVERISVSPGRVEVFPKRHAA